MTNNCVTVLRFSPLRSYTTLRENPRTKPCSWPRAEVLRKYIYMENNKRLERSKKDKIFLGVCAGIGIYFDIDPILIRVLFLLLTVTGGSGLLLYLFLAVLMPKEGQDIEEHKQNINNLAQDIKHSAEHVSHEVKAHFKSDYHERKRKHGLFGWIIILVGLFLLVEAFAPHIPIPWQAIIAGIVVLFGLSIVARR